MSIKWIVFVISIVTYSVSVSASINLTAFTNKELSWIEAVKKRYGSVASQRVIYWRQLMSELSHSDKTELEKIESVNLFFNQLNFIDDSQLWGVEDYWATPLEFLGSNAGDCEDFTIAKYFSLLELGIEDQKLRLVYVKSIRLNQFHMVLAYYPTQFSTPLILDNIDTEIKLATQREDLLPVYSFNGKHLWIVTKQRSQLMADDSSRLSLWNDLRRREKEFRLKLPILNFNE